MGVVCVWWGGGKRKNEAHTGRINSENVGKEKRLKEKKCIFERRILLIPAGM